MTGLKKFIFTFIFCFLAINFATANSATVQEEVIPQEEEMAGARHTFGKVIDWYQDNMNYFTLTLLMLLENTFLPIPSELVISPAAYFASRPDSDMNVLFVIIFGTLGALLGALIIYGLSAWLGRKALYKFVDTRLGNFFMLDSEKLHQAEEVFNKRSRTSICIGRLLPGIRLLISIPAGLAKMNLGSFILYTIIGTGIYNAFLALIGYVLHGQSDLITKYSYELSILAFAVMGLMLVVFIIRFILLRWKMKKTYGLIGYPLGHSFSKKYFTEKFKKESIKAKYELFEIPDISEIEKILKDKKVSGLNVTIPYKEKVFKYVNELDDTAADIGAINVLKINRSGNEYTIKGYNSDAIGFEQSIKPSIKPYHKKALILGTGGASKAINYVLKKSGIETTFVSRTEKPTAITYDMLPPEVMESHLIIVNCTPLGTFPNVDTCPDIPYQYLTNKHLLFDAVYNPAETLFMKKGKEQGAEVINGEQMLIGQAEAAWEIWNEDSVIS